jgi:hypothetical protein
VVGIKPAGPTDGKFQIFPTTDAPALQIMKTLMFTVSHDGLESLMCAGRLARLLDLKDLGHLRDQYVVTALVRDEHLDAVIEKSSDRPRWVRWPPES